MIIIDLRYVNKIPDMVAQLAPIFESEKNSTQEVFLNFNVSMIYPEYLALIVASFNWARENGMRLIIYMAKEKDGKSDNLYPLRIGFYKLIGYQPRRRIRNYFSNIGRFIEITPVEFDHNLKKYIDARIVDDIIEIFRTNYKVNESIYRCLNYCLWEQIDNIQTHSGEKGTGYVVAQNYKNKNQIRICVVDTGMGIFNSLTKTENSTFKGLLYKDAIKKCIEEHVTRGTGMGNGLYHSSQFIIENKGEFILYSGNYYIRIVDGVIEEVKRGAEWKGTIIFQKVNTQQMVDYNRVFNNCGVPGTVLECCDDVIEILWE